MSKATTVIRGITYELATTLRVAYEVQGKNGHKPYADIFSELDHMPIEKQIEILYVAFKVANKKDGVVNTISEKDFLDWYLDNYDIKTIMEQLQAVIGGILGQNLKAASDSSTESEGN